jgi:hypothetical protein
MDTAQGMREKADVAKVNSARRAAAWEIKKRPLFFSDGFFLRLGVLSGAQVAAEDVSTTGFDAESEREVPTGPDPIHHHGRGPRRQSP